MKLNKNIAFIGAGRMAEALIKGLIAKKVFDSQQVVAADKDLSRLAYLKDKYQVRIEPDNPKAVSSAGIVILSVKPAVMAKVLEEISVNMPSGRTLFISIAAGITLGTIEEKLRDAPVIRAMPNNPVLVGEGMTALCCGRLANNDDQKTAEDIFGSVGKVLIMSEELMDAVTAVSGSGPAFIYYIVEAMTEAGIKAGLSKSQANLLVSQTLLGAARTLLESGSQPSDLREMVTSPGGTTQAGLKVLDEGRVKEILVSAILAAAKRAREISATSKK